ncbi:M23 family metallopeptidase [Tellurirhabdus rosea]|uniref:M23 family metallopeptidase n=1 Tax=Tellurirhabdus rosea TaxID=2674997 RepID=UPI00225759D9|nr:M23 family metallopeptidase [Tellurirhabdus rosea]
MAAVAGLLWGLVACTGTGPGKLFQAASPHEQYARSLREARLERTALGTDWLNAGNRALQDSLVINAPYRESGYFSANKPFAVGYRLRGQRGDKFIIRVDVQGMEAARVFIDVFELNEQPSEGTPNRLLSAKADTNQLELEIRRNRLHLIRIQPELLRSGRYTISITREPVLSFPVVGRDSRTISSYFGVPRDGGRRRHEGIDIFAPRGTPVVASTEGVISGVGVNNLGGNVVWLSDMKRSQSLYYAHLDAQAVREGQRVAIGDTVGFVGNTGNARTTAPHLHFGIYRFNEGAVDPLPYVRRGLGPARQTPVQPELLGDSMRISAARAVIRQAPNGEAAALLDLPRSAVVRVVGGTAAWLRVQLPNERTGYVSGNQTEPVRIPLRRRSLSASTTLRDAAHPMAAVIDQLNSGTTVEVLGVFERFQLVRSRDGLLGWILNTPE